MKTSYRKIVAVLLSVLALVAVMTVSVFATEAPDAPAPDAPIAGTPDTPAPQPTTPAETAAAVLKGIFSGTNLALLGVALAVALPCMGSAKGLSLVGEASSGLLSEDPTLFGKTLLLQALPMTQGVYGLVAAFLMLAWLGLFSNVDYLVNLTYAEGAYYLMSALPIALAGFYSAVRQGRVAASGVSLLSKRPGEVGKAITSAALVETYAVFALLITLFLVFLSPFKA